VVPEESGFLVASLLGMTMLWRVLGMTRFGAILFFVELDEGSCGLVVEANAALFGRDVGK
jgi:hypothetical protein